MQEFKVLGSHYALPLNKDESSTKAEAILTATIMFAREGYNAVSMRKLADAIGIRPASLYNHFGSKEDLFKAVIDHAKELYLLYFSVLSEKIDKAVSFEAVLDIIFEEPIKMDNTFTCYAFGLVQVEQFYNQYAAQVYNDIFLAYSVRFFALKFDRCIELGYAVPFDTEIAATVIMHSVLSAIASSVQVLMGREIPCNPGHMLENLKMTIGRTVESL